MTTARVDAYVSASLDMTEANGGFRFPAMRQGYHFDVVFSDDQAQDARTSVVSFANELAQRHATVAQAEERAPADPADVYIQLRVAGVWKREITRLANGAVRERLVILADGWAYDDFQGRTQSYGSLEVAIPEMA